MRRLVIEVTDDLCGRTVDELDAYQLPFCWEEVDYLLDLCPECYAGIGNKKISAVLAAARRSQPEKAARKPGEWMDQFKVRGKYQCPADGCGLGWPTGQGLATHTAKAHGFKLSEWVAP